MYIPASTYRIQVSSSFTLKDLEKAIPYLHQLGISTIYSAPFFQSRSGSSHGYDIVDPLKINDEIGTLDEFKEISRQLKELEMGWLQDIVPNHMAFDSKNKWLINIFERGPQSEYHEFFDINWEYNEAEYHGKVMTPFLGEPIEEVISNGNIKLFYGSVGFYFKYYDHQYPASAPSYHAILEQGRQFMEKALPPHDHIFDSYLKIQEAFEMAWEDEGIWQKLKEQLFKNYQDNSTIHDAIDDALEVFNSNQRRMSNLLEKQYFKLCHWQETEQKINFRRFFTINDLICLQMDNEKVFQHYHSFIYELCKEDLVQGLRIDHIDGLFNPAGYLKNLRELVGDDIYLVIEKILEWEEFLPSQWPIHGTSGYVFLALVSNLFTESSNEKKFTKAYKELAPDLPDYESLVYEKKHFILKNRMGGELNNLFHLMDQLNLLPEGARSSEEKWKEALNCFLAAFPVYRIYPTHFPLSNRQKKIIDQAHQAALSRSEDISKELDYLHQVFSGTGAKEEESMAFFLQRCQQFTGPLAAKGVEDTSYYIYNRLISHNEVGDTPHVFGITTAYFHERMQRRLEKFPHSVNATATHDTKRGEDARMRINVLSELPEEWFQKVKEWHQLNLHAKRGASAPDYNEEYFIYQTLIGHSPFDGNFNEEFLKRTRQYMQKVLREGKTHSRWAEPDEEYEKKVYDFIVSVVKDKDFLQSFIPFMQKVAYYGALYSLSQTLIKITAPGIPDIYQGTELWDFSYVDPDNRRPINYEERAKYLKEMDKKRMDEERRLINDLLENYTDGRIKLYTICKSLMERKKQKPLFDEGAYLPLEITGSRSNHGISYARRHHKDWCIIIAPKMLTSIADNNTFPLGEQVWQDNYISLPEDAPFKWINVFTDEKISVSGKLYLHEAFAHFPVAFLWGES